MGFPQHRDRQHTTLPQYVLEILTDQYVTKHTPTQSVYRESKNECHPVDLPTTLKCTYSLPFLQQCPNS